MPSNYDQKPKSFPKAHHNSLPKNQAAIDGKPNQWPSLQRPQDRPVRVDHNGHSNFLEKGNRKLKENHEYSSPPSEFHHKSSEQLSARNGPKNYPGKINSEKDKNLMDSENGWVTVTKKGLRKAVPCAQVDDKTVQVENEQNSTEIETEKRKQQHQIRKQRIKEQKMRKREEKAKELRDNSRRDTKVQFISPEFVSSFMKSNRSANTFSSSQKLDYYPDRNDFVHDYPSLAGSKKPFKNKNKENLSQIDHQSQERVSVSRTSVSSNLNSMPSRSQQFVNGRTHLLSKPSSDNGMDASSLSNYAPNLHNPEMTRNHTRGKNLPMSTLLGESPIKKKVKSKDLINLEIMDLIKVKRKGVESKSKIAPSEAPPIYNHVERKGKISEGKVKQISTLHKNILRQKKAQTNLLKSILEDEVKKTDHDSSVESKEKDVNEENNSSDNLSKQLPSNQTKAAATDSPSVETTNPPVDPEAHKEMLHELKLLMNPVHSHKFREYCSHVVTPEINQLLKEFIELLVMFQERLYHQDPTKGKMKRRYYCGLKESLKHLSRVSCVVMAPNLKSSPGKGCVDELVWKVIQAARSAQIPVFFGLTHRQLGRLCHRKIPVSCVSIVNIQGAQDKFHRLLELVPVAEKQYQQLLAQHNLNSPLEEGPEEMPGEKEERNITDSLLEALKK